MTGLPLALEILAVAALVVVVCGGLFIGLPALRQPKPEPEPECKLCGGKKQPWQVFCGAACSAEWEAGKR